MNQKAVKSWILYDWANSAFATTIMAAVMPIYYSSVAAANLPKATSTAYWGYTQSVALIFVVLLSPLLGAIADYAGNKKSFLCFFTYMGAISSSLLFFVGEGDWALASILVILGTLAFSGGNVFYDAFLPEIAVEKDRDMISSRGYASGYIGGGILLAVNLVMIQNPSFFGIDTVLASQISFLSVGIWWIVFTIPFFRNVSEKPREKKPLSIVGYTQLGFQRVASTLQEIRRFPELLKFLVAFWFFSDGINTIIKMATIYGTEIGIESSHLIIALLITQFVGFPATLLFGKIASCLGSKSTLQLTLVIYLLIVTLGYFMKSETDFYLLAIMVGMVQGGAQALSRSIFSNLVPDHKNAEFFGFFALSGKFASIFGPALFGFVGQVTGSSRFGIASLIFFFLMGIILLYTVNLEKGKQEASYAVKQQHIS